MKTAGIILALIFALFTYFQFNDPDPWAWATWYGVMTVICVLAALDRTNKWLLWAVFGVGAVWMAFISPDFFKWLGEGMPTITGCMKAESPHVELVREFLGLLICLIVLGWLLWKKR